MSAAKTKTAKKPSTAIAKRKAIEVATDGKLKTSGYRPLPQNYFNQPRDLPLFNHAIVRGMLLDPGVRLNLRTREAPLAGAEFGYKDGDKFVKGIQCEDEAIGKWIHRQLEYIWKTYLPQITRAQVWGWSAGEITMRLSENNLVEIDKLEARHAGDCRLLMNKERQKWGVRFDRVQDCGHVLLPFPYCWFHAYDAQEGEFYGTPNLIGAYSPWADKWLNGGGLDTRRLFMHKDAYGGRKLWYPEGTTFIDGIDTPNEQIARRIVEQMESGGVATLPSTTDEHGNRLWMIEEPNTTSGADHILQYPKDLDQEIRHGQEIPDDVISGDDGGSGGWAGRRIPLAAFYNSLDHWVVSICMDLKEQVFDPLIMINWGRKVRYCIEHKPLAEQAMEQQSNAGLGQDKNPFMPGVQSGKPFQMSLHSQAMDPVDAVGRGVLDTADLVEAARQVITMSADADGNRWITIGAETGADGKKVGGTPVKIDKNGKMLTGKFAGHTLEEAFKEGGKADKADAKDDTPDWAQPGTKKVIDGHTLWQGKIGPSRGRWAVQKEDGSNGNYHNSPDDAIENYQELNRNRDAAAKISQEKKSAFDRIVSGNAQDGDLQKLVGHSGTSSITKATASEVLSRFDLRPTDIKKIMDEAKHSGIDPDGATRFDVQDIINRGKEFTKASAPNLSQPKVTDNGKTADAVDDWANSDEFAEVMNGSPRLKALDAAASKEIMTGLRGTDETPGIGPKEREFLRAMAVAMEEKGHEVPGIVKGHLGLSSGIQSVTRPNEAAKAGDQLGLFGEASAPKRDAPPELAAGGESAGKQSSLFDTKGPADQQMLFATDDATPADMVGEKKPPARKDKTPEAPQNRDVYTVPTTSLKVDPKRFQYKITGVGEDGVTDELKGTKQWNPELGGVLLVWRDPANGQDYVINGHHRHELATRTGADAVNVRYIDAKSSREARARGALANIAEGRGSAVDAAKYLRDIGEDVGHLQRAGISMSGRVAADAGALTKLSDKSFQSLTEGMLEESKAVAVAKYLPDTNLQDKLFKKLQAREEDGKDWSIREIETAARKMANAGKVTETGFDLFGDFESEESTFDQEVEIESHVRRLLQQEANDFRSVANARRAERVADAGNVLQVDANAQRQKSAEMASDTFDRESSLRGPVSSAIKDFAAELAKAKTKSAKNEVKQRAMEAVKGLLSQS